ncbi:MAG: carbohydrate binding domain-containing protein, partial [Calditrichota bacterium]
YRASFVYITQKIRQRDLEIATVWNFVPEITQPLDFMSYYPGDAWVDWWAINFFSVYQIDHPATIAFLDSANARQKPMAIGESTPRFIGVANGQQSWNSWFAPLFNRVATEPGVKMTGYINWDWSLFPEWNTWGDARIQQNAIISQNMITEMANPLYLSLGKERTFREALGYTEVVSPPKILSISVQDTTYPAAISWDAVTDISGVSRYLIYKNGQFWDFTGLTELTLLRGEPGEQLQISVQAVDRAGNRAPLSDPVWVNIPQPSNSSDLIQNGDFNNGTDFWNLREYVGNVNANVTIDTTGVLNGNNSAKITVSQNSGTNWHIQFQQGLELKAGHRYAIRYRARASQQTSLETWLQQDHEPWFGYASSTVTLTQNPTTFEDLSVIVDQDDTVFFTFMLGTSGLVDVWVDSIS